MKFSLRILFFAMGLAVAVACAWAAGGDRMSQDTPSSASANSLPAAARDRHLPSTLWALAGILALCAGSLPSLLRGPATRPQTPNVPPPATPAEADDSTLTVALAQLATQLAHDLRSPLAALQIVSQHAPELSEEKRLLMRDALQRLNDIANNVLTRYQRAALPHDVVPQTTLLASLVQSTVSDRRAVAHKAGIELLLDISADAGNAFADLEPDRFRRALASFIDHAVASSPKTSPVHLHMHSNAATVVFTLRHQGRDSAAPSAQQGLGLAGAQAAFQAFGGSTQLDYAPNRGTSVRLELPRAPAAAWFAEAITIPARTCVLVIDDDDAIGRVWSQRIGALPAEHGIEFRVCKYIEEFIAHVHDPAITIGACLVDYELMGEARSGLDVVLELGLEGKTTVITSHDGDPDLRARCIARHIKIVPKAYAAHVLLTVL